MDLRPEYGVMRMETTDMTLDIRRLTARASELNAQVQTVHERAEAWTEARVKAVVEEALQRQRQPRAPVVGALEGVARRMAAMEDGIRRAEVEADACDAAEEDEIEARGRDIERAVDRVETGVEALEGLVRTVEDRVQARPKIPAAAGAYATDAVPALAELSRATRSLAALVASLSDRPPALADARRS